MMKVFAHHENAKQTAGTNGAFKRWEVEADAEGGAEPPGRQFVDFPDVQLLVYLSQDIVNRVARDTQVIGHFFLRSTPSDSFGYLSLAIR